MQKAEKPTEKKGAKVGLKQLEEEDGDDDELIDDYGTLEDGSEDEAGEEDSEVREMVSFFLSLSINNSLKS